MSLGAHMPQEYPFVLQQLGTSSPELKILLIQHSFYIADSTFALSELLNLDILFPPSGNTINFTILNDPIFYIPYISQLLSTPPIADKFPMDDHRNIYMVAIDN